MLCSVYLDQTMSCNDGNIRLSSGANEFSGRVEQCMGNQWRAVCADQWGEDEATVVCRQLGLRTDGQHQLHMYQ